MVTESEHKLGLRHLRIEDYEAVRDISAKAYKGLSDPWTKEELESLINRFSEGQICVEDNGKPVAVALSIMITFSLFGKHHTYNQITANGTLQIP